ncbi:MAG: TolC family protein [Pseudomonadota bacterium]
MTSSSPALRAVIAAACLGFVAACTHQPVPFTDDERATMIQQDADAIQEMTTAVDGPITLHEAMARTVLFNLDHRVTRMQELVSLGQFELAQFEMLPELSYRLQGIDRDPRQASSSRSIFTGQQTLEPSTSQDRSRALGDLTFSWNVLDLGVSYFQARQDADRAIISDELRRRSMHTLMEDVRGAFWRAYAAQELSSDVEEVLDAVKQALVDVSDIEEGRLQPPLQTLRFRRSLIDLIGQLEQLSADLDLAKVELLSLMNLPSSTDITLSVSALEAFKLPVLDMPQNMLEQIALDQRPELREQLYETRITANEARRVLFDALPGLELSLSGNADSNSFLVDNFWREASATLLGNIVDLLTLGERLEQAEFQGNLADAQRLAIHLAIISQVNIAKQQYTASSTSFQRASEVLAIEELIANILTQEAEASAGNPLEKVRAEASALFAKLARFQSYADAQAAYGRILASLGVDLVPEDAYQSDVPTLSADIKDQLSNWSDGAFITAMGYDKTNQSNAQLSEVSDDEESAPASETAAIDTNEIFEAGP